MPDFIQIDPPKGSLYELTLAVASGQVDKARIALFFRSHTHHAT